MVLDSRIQRRCPSCPGLRCPRLDTFDVAPETVTLSQGAEAQPLLVMTFDDGRDQFYAFNYAHSHHVNCTAYIITDRIGQEGYLTAAQLAEMEAGGWDIANHTMSHPSLTLLTQAQQEAQFTGAAAALEAIGITRAVRHVAYPYGGYNATTLDAMAAAEMITGRVTAQDDQFDYPPASWYEIGSRVIEATTTLDTVKGWIDDAITNGQVLCLYTHRIIDGAGGENWTPEQWEGLVDYIAESDIVPVTVTQLYALLTGDVDVPVPD